ncbi:hypothetical protein O6H91_03G113600 [Diphasiastrum complanatum]|uniref:Uncharacterized protein n=1 Tax=Diphasiastrum complanatum TaxID=34168 RepID=A0ACC2EA81_DIPCM|nr:hypothetical protein O6H91_03G113600 [Diphasiastrum complanatum]
MVRLTADLIFRSPQYFNAVRERELDLRDNKIAAIENLGATEDLFDSIDLSDNEIVKLEGFPPLKRLTTLLVNNNRIARVSPLIGVCDAASLPKLQTLVLTNNRLVNLVDLDPIATLSNLQTLCLLDNLVTKQPNYRLYVIHKLPNLRLLDFRKVKLKERQEAKMKFGSKEAEEEVKKIPVKTFTPGEVLDSEPVPVSRPEDSSRSGPTPEQILAIKAAIANSQTLEEVARLEKALKMGQLPADLKLPGDEESANNSSKTDGPVFSSNDHHADNEAMEEG